MTKLKRALSVHDVLNYKPDYLGFTGKWLELTGDPESKGTWIIWGNSTNGKTRFALKLAKYLAQFKRVIYDSLEEGMSASILMAYQEIGMQSVAKRLLFLNMESIEDLKARLRKRKSPEIIFIDSLKYSGLTYNDYKKLRDEFRDKIFVFVQHADGKEPQGNVGKSIRYDAMVKIRVEGYKAFAESRFGGGTPYVIWDKGAREYWDYK